MYGYAVGRRKAGSGLFSVLMDSPLVDAVLVDCLGLPLGGRAGSYPPTSAGRRTKEGEG